jgi:drug/metabolite transporter (DMT)-like permease
MCRVLFAGLALTPTLRRRDVSFRPLMLVMVTSFTVMNGLYLAAMAGGTAANAVLLQYTAPLWVFVASVLWLGERIDRRSLVAVIIGSVGIVVIVLGEPAELKVIAMALGSGVSYAGVLLCLRLLRAESSRWLTVLNHLCGALFLLPLVAWTGFTPWPSPAQLAVLVVFGTVQMALPYWLVARGLRVVSAQEAGAITLLEPILNPFWAYLVAREVPSPVTFVGGAFILGALAWRYWPSQGLDSRLPREGS